ncbi:ABC transporter substrate-binding protein [Microvirga sp. BT689]|uniref:ABC transporter substrate-binding protein n=1 Tax=Microvirga arvi TaxID=2778731 RepID=UPI00195046B1|nr:ABC transporter substrate-binding protein [Microvirga arvi]MBM6581885.1 ABC transporter substrate-binding protein [Microvirga arvi]
MKFFITMAMAGALSAGHSPAFAQDSRNTLTIAQSVDVESLEPHALNASGSINVANHLWVTLLQVTASGEVQPYLAESYRWNEAGTELTFQIKPGHTCEDGTPITAEDVAFSLKRAADKKLNGNIASFVYPTIGFVDARADGDYTATVVVKKYQSIVPGMLAQAYIVCRKAYEGMSYAEAATKPFASGPYRLKEWKKDDRVTLERNDSFKLREVPFKTLNWRVVPEASTRLAELIAGNADLVTNILPDQQASVAQSGRAVVKTVSGTRRIFVGFNFNEPFKATKGGAAIQKPEVRQALNMAVDVPTICRQLLAFECQRTTGPANLANPALKPYPFDPARAEKMLDEVGYPKGPDGVRFELTLQGPRGRYLNDVAVQQAVGQYLDDIGVRTKVEIQDFISTFSPAAREHRAGPLYFIGQGGVTWSAVYDMALFPSREAPVNNGMWHNPEWQRRWDSLAGIRDPDQERTVVNEMLEIFYRDPPWIMMYFQPDFYGVSNRIAWEPRRDERIDALTASVR